MFRQLLTRAGVSAVVAAVLLAAGPAWARPHGGGGHGGGGHGGGFHGGGFHGGGFHGGGFHGGGFHGGGFHGGGFHNGGFRGSGFRHGGYYPGYYGYYPSYGYSAPYSYYPSYDPGYGSAPDPGYLDPDGGVPPSYSGGYQALAPLSTASSDTAAAQADPTAHLIVRVPANAEIWFDGSTTTSKGAVRWFQSPPLTPGRFTYEVRARWTENGHDVTQTQKVSVSPGAYATVDFPVRSGTD
jgi:uncharacterized protein (TIGR03000 family)